MRFAIIDLGTNTFNLLIAEVVNNHAEVIFRTKIPVKLGKGGLSKNLISPDAYERGINALKEHKKTIEHYQCKTIHAFATSGIRSTTNGGDFVDQVRQELDINIQVISGEREAELIYKGVRQALEIPANSCIMDIGGGSTEFIICNHNEILWKKSYRLGVSRLYELLQPKDPLTKQCIITAEHYLEEHLSDLFEELEAHQVHTIIGSSGSFETFFDVICHKKNNCKSERVWEEIQQKDFVEIHKDFITLTLEQRLAMPGMIEMRADMIPLGSLMTNYILNQHPFEKMLLSHYALKEGVMQEIMEHMD
jgi:exopolyphosphatase / guanosine-5'-triphosphate,3'-diphosphate pyrophosphatase